MALVTVQRSPTPSTTSSPCVSESGSGEDDRRSQPRSISESFLTVKGAALFLPRGNSPTPNLIPCVSQRRNKHTGDLQQHLQTMFTVLRPEDNIRLAVRLESAYPQCTRYMVVVSTNGRQDTEESIVLGVDFPSSDSCCTVGLVLPLWSDTLIHLDGDGGFSVSTVNRVHVFKPVSVQAMWSALQSLHKACEVARSHNYYPGSLFLTWVSYYQSRVSSDQLCINEWNTMQDVQSHRTDSPVLFADVPTERERTERLIMTRLREIMMQKDLENVTSKEIRTELEMQMVCNLREFKEFIDKEMIVILGQMDSPTEIFDHVFLGSEWNASNLEELQNSGVRYILNVTREIDNFFPGMFEYHNIRVYDEEATNLLEYWNETFKFITKAKKAGAKCLVHCKMGVSRSASTVIAYAMKEYGWDLETAFHYVKERRTITKPNPSFMRQLEEYQGILLASKQRHNKLWRSHSDSDISDRPEPLCKPASHSLGRSDPHNNNNNSTTPSPSLHHLLGMAVLQALTAEPKDAHANGVRASPGEQEDPLLPPPPRPRAAAVVPLRVATTAPAPVPHPPPTLHILPPTPQPQHASLGTPARLCRTAPAHKPGALSLDLPGRSSDSDTTENSLSDSASDRDSLLSPATPSPLSPGSSLGDDDDDDDGDDDNNNPSESRPSGALDGHRGADGSSGHSTDSIDFFSAREKFLGLAQDGRARALSEPAQQRTPPPSSLPLEDRGDMTPKKEAEDEKSAPFSEDSLSTTSPDHTHPTQHHDNGISVRHIVTEIESIFHPASSISSGLRSPQPPQPGHQEDRETGGVTQGSLTPPPSSPSTPPPDWPAGSVRRATKQLEQRLKQELETSAPSPAQRSPLHSPSAEQPPLKSPLCSPGAHTPQGEASSAPAEPRAACSGSHKELQRLPSGMDTLPHPAHAPSPVSAAPPVPQNPATVPPGAVSTSGSPCPDATPRTETHGPIQTSLQSPGQHQPLCSIHPQSRQSHLSLEGVTAQELDTDEGLGSDPGGRRAGCSPACGAQKGLARSSQELERIQQTLRELQAFLREASGAETEETLEQPGPGPRSGSGEADGPREAMDTDSVPGEASQPVPGGGVACGRWARERQGKSFREPAGWQRAVGLEARIRQAGLTPPSLMKRSASLAKLDRLELSANDLSDWDLSPHNGDLSSSNHLNPCPVARPPHPSSGPDEAWKKQRVLVQIPHIEKTGWSHQGSRRPREPSSPPPLPGESEEPPARQQARGHPSRRARKVSAEKKQRTVTVLYNTM